MDVDLSCGSVVEPFWKQHCLEVAVKKQGGILLLWNKQTIHGYEAEQHNLYVVPSRYNA